MLRRRQEKQSFNFLVGLIDMGVGKGKTLPPWILNLTFSYSIFSKKSCFLVSSG